jgi:hypothetical protein
VVVLSVPVAFGSSVKPPVDELDELELEAVSCAVLDSSPSSSASVVELAAAAVVVEPPYSW